MDFNVLTIFPDMIRPVMDYGVVGKAVKNGKIHVNAVDIRSFATDKHKMTDDRPFGGGAGMVMKPEPLAAAVRDTKKKAEQNGAKTVRTILLSPQGRVFDQWIARELSREDALILVCGRYEGPDERICTNFIDDEISIGDFVLSGGEPAAMMIIDAVSRLIPGVLGDDASAITDSFSAHLIEHGHYTRPRVFEGEEVPEVLLSGNHSAVEKWRLETSVIRTFLKRPDLITPDADGKNSSDNGCLRLTEEEIGILKRWRRKIDAIVKSYAVK